MLMAITNDSVNRITHKFVFLVMLCAVFCSADVFAVWGEKGGRLDARATQISVQDGVSNNLGVFAGVVQTHDSGEFFRSAYLVMSPQGYLMPVFANGEVAVVEPVYFQSKNCSGPKYTQVSSRLPVFTS